MIEGRSIWELIEKRAAASPEALFAVDEDDRRLSFAGYLDACLRCAAGLSELGVGRGGHVSWVLPTCLEAMVLAGALSRLGARQNPILPIYRHREVGFITKQSRASLLVVPRVFRGYDYEEMAHALAAEQPGLEVWATDRVLPDGNAAALPARPATGDEPTWLFYTSGTTADPKGALHTDTTLMAFATGLVQLLELREDDRIAMVFPFTHVGGAGWLLAGLMSGAAQIAIAVFDPENSPAVLARHGVTQATAGTAFHQAYLEAQRRQGRSPLFPAVRAFPGGGAPKPPQLHIDLRNEIGGVGIVSGYGLTECPIATMNGVRDPDDKLAHTEGRRNPETMKIAVVRTDGEPAGPDKEGEIRVRGPQLFRGYLDSTLDTDAFDDEGFFRTGDLGRLDADGFLTITGRLKDVIIRNGENISAKEIEDLLYRHPKVADVAVVGLPDARTGERCCAVVACRDEADPLEFDEMADFLRKENLMIQKIPEQLERLTPLPRNPTGKILKHELRARFGSGDGGR